MIRGQRFELDLGEDGDQEAPRDDALSGAFVGDILERKTAAATPPTAPTLKSKSGFPEHKKRNVESRFKQRKKQSSAQDSVGRSSEGSQLEHNAQTLPASRSSKAKTWEEEEKQRIDIENREKLAQMSPTEIEAERQELMDSLSSALLQRLLQRSNINSGTAEENFSNPALDKKTEKKESLNSKKVSFLEPVNDDTSIADTEANDSQSTDDREMPIADTLQENIHFPRPAQPPDLDPSSETFLEDLHNKYFPSLPSDPDKLEWMQSPTGENTYDPSATALNPKDLRFSFKGDLIPPKTASKIPVTAGLHHHGDAPDAAGYTIPELAHLAKSSYPAQRCIAFQTLGRILYRLGKGEFGDSGEPGADTVGVEDTFGELARGLWREVEREKVIEIVVRESEGKGVDKGRHVSAKAYATEAVWLWQKGGGRRWKAS